MRIVPFDCPPAVFPNSFEGDIVLAISEFRGSDESTLWLLFEVKKGSTVVVYGVFAGRDMPEEMAQRKPIVAAAAPRSIWKLLVDDEEQFYRRVSDARVHISGDYRVFGRYALSLLRAIRTTNLWERLDEVANAVTAST